VQSVAETVRVFFALEASASDALCAEARNVVTTLRKRCGRVRRRGERTLEARWLREESWHVTLRFLGEVAVGQVGELARQAREALVNVAPFDLRLGCAMTFPPKRPRTLALNIEPHAPLSELAARVEQGVLACGFASEGHDFAPHLTLARIKAGHFRESDAAGVAAAGVVRLRVDEIVLFRSELRPDGAHYTPLERIALQECVAQGGNVHP
jgi:2'-5' RNA ligase